MLTAAPLFSGTPRWFVPDTPFPRVSRVAVVAPHPDDFDVIAVTLREAQRLGARIELAVLTSGASGVEDTFFEKSRLATKRAIREREQVESCAFFGLPAAQLHFLRLEEDAGGHIASGAANDGVLNAFLSDVAPELVFLPHGNDSNIDHQRTFAMVSRLLAAQPGGATLFLNRDPKTIAMREDLYVLFDEETAEWKRALLRHHASQQDRNLRSRGRGFDARILDGNGSAALAAGRPGRYAEVFELRVSPK
ncbi:MAG: PIG-L deacetylase family protein [Gemmatimonadales bacterium]